MIRITTRILVVGSQRVKYKFKNNLKEILNEVEANKREVKSMEGNKETLKKIDDFCVVAACSQFIKDNRKHSRVSNTRKRKCWIKPWLTEKYKSLYYELVSELLLHDKEKFRMFLRMTTATYKVSKFVLISRCATSWGRRCATSWRRGWGLRNVGAHRP